MVITLAGSPLLRPPTDISPRVSRDYPAAVMALAGLVQYWRLNELAGAIAAATVGLPGAYHGPPNLGQPSLVQDSDPSMGCGATGSGLSVYMDQPVATSPIPHGANPRTVTLWEQTVGVRVFGRTCFSSGQNNNAGDMFALGIADPGPGDNQIFVDTWFGGLNPGTYTVTPDPLGGDPHFLAASYDGATTIKVYYDGSLLLPVTTTAVLHTIRWWDPVVGRNAQGGQPGQSFDMSYDEVAIWNRALTDAEVAGLWDAGKPS